MLDPNPDERKIAFLSDGIENPDVLDNNRVDNKEKELNFILGVFWA
jgi:hypothetical protein